jgi:hypothetical protein
MAMASDSLISSLARRSAERETDLRSFRLGVLPTAETAIAEDEI